MTEHKLTDYQNHTGITEVFAFDPASNRVPVKVGEDSTDKTQTDMPKREYGRPRELIQNGKRIRYTYDSQGRVLYKTFEAVTHPDTSPRTVLQLEYNANNELAKSLQTQYHGNTIIKTQTDYHYDAFGRRIAKQSQIRHLTQSNEHLRQFNKTKYQQTHFLWNGDLPIQEYSDCHVYTTVYDQDSFNPVARLMWLRDDIPQPINDELEDPQGWYRNNKPEPSSAIAVYYYHNDQLGTPNELTDSEGKVIWLADYEAWGETAKVIYNEIKINQIKVSQNELQSIRFQGQHFDNETGLHYNRFRYYDPDLGMFTSRDPIGLMGGDNVFAYAPNPTGWVDPLGLQKKPLAEAYNKKQNPWNSKHGTIFDGIAKNGRKNWTNQPVQKKSQQTCSLKNTTSMTNMGVGVSVFAGASVGAGVGSSCSDKGIKIYIIAQVLVQQLEQKLVQQVVLVKV